MLYGFGLPRDVVRRAPKPKWAQMISAGVDRFLADDIRRSKREMAAMKPTAFLINIARDNVVDEPELIKALEEGRIAGAALDVFAVEPLPQESRLWELPNVIFSPHMAGAMEMDGYGEMAFDIFCQNLERYLAGKRLTRVADRERG